MTPAPHGGESLAEGVSDGARLGLRQKRAQLAAHRSGPINQTDHKKEENPYFSTIARMSRAERIKYSSPLYFTSVPPYLE